MLTIALLLAALAGGPKPAINLTDNLALNGYDAVAYVTDGKPVPGYIHEGSGELADSAEQVKRLNARLRLRSFFCQCL